MWSYIAENFLWANWGKGNGGLTMDNLVQALTHLAEAALGQVVTFHVFYMSGFWGGHQKASFWGQLGVAISWVIQPACFGAGCYIEMALSYHQPHQHELVGG